MKRLLTKCALLLALCAALALSVLPFEARAASDAWDGTVDISWYDPAKTEYEIDTPAKLAGLAALVNGMADPTAKKIVGNTAYLVSKKVDNVMLVGAGGGNVFDTVYTGGIDFAYKTIYLTADLDMGGRKGASGSWTGPNWTPIGGKFPMKPAEAAGDCMTLDTRFNGILDGQGHTIYNLYCNRYAAKGFPYSMAVGVVGFLGGNADYANGVSGERSEAEFETGWQPAVRNLVLGSGWIYARRMVGGIVGRVGETSNGVIIENCAVTKEQAAVLLVRFARIQGAAIPADAAPVYVAECSAWAQTDVQAAYAAGILDRYAACLAAPQQAASRAELARMLRLLSTLLQKA